LEEKKNNLSDDCLGREVAEWMVRVKARVTARVRASITARVTARQMGERGALETPGY